MALSRDEAKKSGAKRYFTGEPCANGHVAERLVSNYGCAECAKAARRKWGLAHPGAQRWFEAKWRTPVKVMLRSARRRAKVAGVPFSITADDVHIPEVCPVLGIVLKRGTGKPDDCSPTLDRRIPRLGYVPGNVAVISSRANRIKTDATLAELDAVAAWLRK